MSSLEDKVCSLIQERAAVGKAKYGTSMERTDLSEKEWLQHAQEEALDFAVYIEKLKQEACVLSKDDLKELLELVTESLAQLLPSDNTRYRTIWIALAKKLQDAINLV